MNPGAWYEYENASIVHAIMSHFNFKIKMSKFQAEQNGVKYCYIYFNQYHFGVFETVSTYLSLYLYRELVYLENSPNKNKFTTMFHAQYHLFTAVCWYKVCS